MQMVEVYAMGKGGPRSALRAGCATTFARKTAGATCMRSARTLMDFDFARSQLALWRKQTSDFVLFLFLY